MSDLQDVLVPDVGGEEVEVIEVCVSVGDSVEAEDSLITVESDKASMDIPAPSDGEIGEIIVKVGDKVSQNSLIMKMSSAKAVTAVAEEPLPVIEEPKAAEEHASQPAIQEISSPAPAADLTSAVIEVHVPDIGGDENVDIIEVLVEVGESIEKETGLITLETDKATMDVPSPENGVVKSIEVSVGDKVSEGSLVLMLETTSSVAPVAESQPAPKEETKPTPVVESAPEPKRAPVPHHPSAGEVKGSGSIYASPAVRRLAREFGVDLAQVKGTGRKARILKEDVQSYVKYELSRPKMTPGSSVASGSGGLQVLAPPKVDFTKFGEVEEIPLTRIQKISGPNLHRNWVTIPHVTQFDEADITELEAFRKSQNAISEKKKLGIKITPLVFMMKAVADALRTYPVFNSSLSESGESLIQKKYFHIGIAVETPGGLVVPVVRDVDKKGIYALS